MAFAAIQTKNEAALVDGLSQGASIDVNDMSCGIPMLALAVAAGMNNAVAAILDRRPNVNLAATETGMTALHVAVANGRVDYVRRLLLAGADVNQPFGPANGPRWMCLATAMNKGNLEMVRVLLEAGAKPDCDLSPNAPTPEDRGVTPLTLAACKGDLELMRLLIKHGANVNHWPPSTATPLMQAVFTGQTAAAKLLVESGALIELHSMKLNANAYTVAVRKGNTELVEFFRARSKVIRESHSPT